MEARSIENIINKIIGVVESHKLDGEEKYARWIWQSADNDRELGINEYGCADAANILYTVGLFERDADKRACWISTIQNLQD